MKTLKQKTYWYYWVPVTENWESTRRSPKEPVYSHSKRFGSGTINVYTDAKGFFWAQFS